MDYTPRSHAEKWFLLITSLLLHLILLIFIFLTFVMDQEFASRSTTDFNPQILSQSTMDHQAQIIFQDEPTATRTLDVEQEKVASPTQEEEPVAEQHEDQQETVAPMVPERLSAREIIPMPIDAAPMAPTTPATKKKRKKAAPITLKQLTQGFLKSMAQEQGGKPQSGLDPEMLARHRYGTKVWSLMRQSYNALKAPTHLYSTLATDAVFVMTIAQDGTLKHAELKHSNKNHDLREIESILTSAAHKAGLYPPVPAQFNTDTITLSFPLGIRVQEGVHTYDLMYN